MRIQRSFDRRFKTSELYQHAFADHWRTVVMDLSRTSAPVQDHIVFDDQG
jgi:hypothetical protein